METAPEDNSTSGTISTWDIILEKTSPSFCIQNFAPQYSSNWIFFLFSLPFSLSILLLPKDEFFSWKIYQGSVRPLLYFFSLLLLIKYFLLIAIGSFFLAATLIFLFRSINVKCSSLKSVWFLNANYKKKSKFMDQSFIASTKWILQVSSFLLLKYVFFLILIFRVYTCI